MEKLNQILLFNAGYKPVRSEQPGQDIVTEQSTACTCL